MERPFAYDHYVTGKNFVGRKMDCNILGNLLEKGEHVVIYDPPKSGKMSVIQQTLFNMRALGKQFAVVRVNMFNVRSIEQFLITFGTSVIRPMYSTTAEYMAVVEKFLAANPDFEIAPIHTSYIKSDEGMIYMLPFEHLSDGFFMAKIRRK